MALHKNPNDCSFHKGRPVKDTDLEKAFSGWIVEQREFEIAISVSTINIIAKALLHDSSFKYGYHKKIFC